MQQENCHDSVSFSDLLGSDGKKPKRDKPARDKYTPHFCSQAFYLSHQSEFQTIHNYIQDYPASIQVIVWTITLSCLRRKQDWFGGKDSTENTSVNKNLILSKEKLLALYDLFNSIQIHWPEKIDRNISLTEFLHSVRIKPLPKAALSGMYHFLVGEYPLVILDHEPNAYEVLKFQIQNQRVLTFESDFSKWPSFMYGKRDPLSFWLHDFIHAEHFFSNPKKRQAQVGFYKFTQAVLNSKVLDQFLLNDEFVSNFSYLISDMNSHPIHLLQTFRAQVEQQNLDAEIWPKITALITSPAASGISSISMHSVKENNNNAHVHEAMSKINTPLFSITDAEILTDFLFIFKSTVFD